MVDQLAASIRPQPQNAGGSPLQRFLSVTEIDTRLLGMVGALVVVWMSFNVLSNGLFLTPRNLWNLSVQTASVSVMATGMVLIIVARHIDLSVGSVLGFLGMVMGIVQAQVLPRFIGFDNSLTWLITLAVGIVVGVAIGAIQGVIIAFLRVPAFIVTLGGFLVWRGAAWWVATGQTIAPMDSKFQLIGGGPFGAIGYWPSWIVGVVACAGIILGIYYSRQQRHRFNFPLRPIWAEVSLATIGCGLTLAAIWVANAYPWPNRIAQRYLTGLGIEPTDANTFIPHGIAIPVLIAVGVGVVMSFIANRTRFGRYVYAMGGNPEAAELAGINTRWVTVKIFMLMGALVTISAAISTARLNAATNALGTLDELYVIAAAVIGGTSLSGGVGTVAGAMLGALVMQSLQSGMVLIGIDSPLQSIVVGLVLVFAVWLDTLYRRRAK